MAEPLSGRRRFVSAALGIAGLSALPVESKAADPDSFAFALIGDNPYGERDEGDFSRVLSSFDPDCEFVIHVGDIKSSSESCADDLLARRRGLLDASPLPLVYTPGDNEWSDCGRPAAGGFEPLERLARVRQMFFAQARSRGSRPLPLQRQSDVYPRSQRAENVRWRRGGLLFVTANRPGGVDWKHLSEAQSAAMQALEAENTQWLRDSFALAARERARAVVVCTHADPFFERDTRKPIKDDTHRPFRRQLRQLSESFGGQVLLLHGDTHRFRVDQPLRDANGATLVRFTRLESFGWPFGASWVHVRVAADQDPAFIVTARHLMGTAP